MSKELKPKKEKQTLMTDFEISDRGKEATARMLNTSVDEALATAKTGAAGAKAYADYSSEDYANLVNSGIKAVGTMPEFLSTKVTASKAKMEYSKAVAADMKGKSLANKGIVAKAYAQHTAVTASEIAAARKDLNKDMLKETLDDIQNNMAIAENAKAAKNSEVVIDADFVEVPNDNYESRASQANKMLESLDVKSDDMSLDITE
jgi:hypothetical protein